jgi:hypothetical protein
VSPTSFDRALDLLTPAVRRIRSTRLRPEAFFVARAGVLTLAYQGFPDPILELKAVCERAFPDLPPENPGSLWPKTTVAALADDRPLVPEEIVQLREATEAGSVCLARGRRTIPAERILLVELRCRSMERADRTATLALEGGPDEGRVPAAHRTAVNDVLTQWRREGLSRYVPELIRAGHRERHYRRTHRELSLVIPLESPVPCLDRFRAEVEERLPGRYAWFAPASLHITVRSLGAGPGR